LNGGIADASRAAVNQKIFPWLEAPAFKNIRPDGKISRHRGFFSGGKNRRRWQLTPAGRAGQNDGGGELMAEKAALLERIGNIAKITMNNPASLNSMIQALLDDTRAAH